MKKNEIVLDFNRPDVKLEKEHLDYVLGEVNAYLIELINIRKSLTDSLIDYRKQLIDENKFDEDRPLDSFDHEMFVKESTFKNNLKRTKEVEELIDSPYFGKIEFKEDGYNKDEIYIGKYGYIKEKGYEPLIIDWRAPIASLFYHGGLGNASYETPNGKTKAEILNRRQFMIKDSILKGMFDSEVEVRDEILQYVLSSNAQNKLKDIIMTIQKEQDDIIRFKRKGTVIVNGVAGSGKTTIALHRIAYLIYNNREALENKILILGPNNIFMKYIEAVLPTLGEESVKQNTLYDFVTELLNFKGDVLSQEDFVEAVLNGDKELLEDSIYKRSTEYIEKLDEYYNSLERDLYPFKEIKFLDKVLMSKAEMTSLFLTEFKYMPLLRRAMRVKRLIVNRLKDERNKKVKEINEKYKNVQKDVESGVVFTSRHQNRRDEIIHLLKEVNEVRNDFRYLGLGDVLELYKRQNTQRILTKDDLIPMLYLTNKIKGVKLPYEIKYLVIDEAQDYSLANFKVIKEITGCNDFTIVGDINQRLFKDTNKSFKDLDLIFNDTTTFNLTRSYRSTDEIVKYASKFANNALLNESLRNGDEVEVIEVNDSNSLVSEIVNTYTKLKDNNIDSIAIITRDLDDAEKLHEKLKDKLYYKFIKSEDGVYSENTLLLSSFLAKGLEFDAVIIVDTKEENTKNNEDLIKYIMATRALHNLTDIKVKNNALDKEIVIR